MVGDPQERLILEVPADLDGVRADRVIAVLSGLTRSEVQRLVDAGHATSGGAILQRRDQLTAGARIQLDVPVGEEETPAEEVDFGVVYQDDDLAVVAKPAGLVVHPGAGNRRGTLVNGILWRWPQVRGVGQPGRWGIVHRLDRDTSGVLAVAKSPAGYDGLKRLVERREMDRRYLALVHGTLELPTGTIDAPLGRDPRHPTRMQVRADGRRAVTHYQVRRSFTGHTLLEVRLETGRTHQIRVHLASIGLPVVGDPVYGRPGEEGVDPGRVWLHAASLEFTHPISSKPVRAEAPLPAELSGSLASVESHA